MKKRWRIFLVCNILEIVIFLIEMCLEFYRAEIFSGPFTVEYWGIFLTITIITVILINCIKNIYLVKVLFYNNTSAKVSGVASWIISVLFLIILFLLSFGLFREYREITNTLNKKDTYLTVVFVLQSLIVINGLFILYNQGPLRRLIRSRSGKEMNTSIEEIGL